MKKQPSKNPLVRLYRQIHLAILQVYRAKGSRHEVALGVAIGAFWGVFPTFGLSTPLIFILYRFIHFNLITAFAGALVSNPLTSPFLLYFSYKVGALFIEAPQTFKVEDWYLNWDKVGWVMLVGSTILSTTVAILMYMLTYYLIKPKT
jgi:hypothetical protein